MSPRAWVLRWHYQLCSCTRLEPRWSAARPGWREGLRDGGGTAAEPADVRGEGGAVGAGRGGREVAGQSAEGPLDLRDRGDTLRFAGGGRGGRGGGAQRPGPEPGRPQGRGGPGR